VTKTDQILKKLAQEKTSYYPNRNSIFSYEVECYLVKLFERELELVRNLNKLIRDLKLRYDYNEYETFCLLDEYNLNHVTLEKYNLL